jgi:hypothetical protein
MRTSFHHRPEAQHPNSSAIHKLAGRLPHLSGAQRTSAHRVIRSATRARDKPAGRAPWRPQPRRPSCFSNSRCRCSASAMGAGWIGVSAFVKQAALRPRLQVLRRTRPCRRTSGYCPLWSWHPPLRIEERDGGAKAALLQSFADNGVRPVLRGRIKSNQFPEMGPALLGRAVNLKQQT